MAGTGEHLHAHGTEDKYVDYLRYLEKSAPHMRRMQEANTLENYAQGYQDFLQMPLQVRRAFVFEKYASLSLQSFSPSRTTLRVWYMKTSSVIL